MKKFLLLSVLFTILAFSCYAQKPSIAFRLGGNYSNFSGSDAEELDLKGIWGGHGGVIITVPVVKNYVGIKTDIIYSMKGAATEDDSLRITLGYIDMPILGQLTAGPFYMEAGPQLSFKVSDNFKNESGRTDLESINNSFKRTSLSYAAGAGIRIPAIGMSIGMRYNGDLSNLVDNIDDREFRNSLLMLTTSFGIPSK
ncbi:porin family protein [Pontibacter vulgaris]|uniref:porin family protein n=1 Tax=Pontibacter vulgaris TaxID=2905679 RepID=UPI001FA6CB46|nr:porin family protein [Pontibacter vulgaris]